MKEYRKINDLPADLKKEIEDNGSFFDNVDGKSLDEQQRIACVLNDCDLEIIAGAGTGKTQTLVAKSNYLIEKKNIQASEILCLSFSTSSVEDLIQRLSYPIETRTIHALGLSIINKYNTKTVLEEYGFFEVFKHYVEDASPKQLFDLQDYCETYLANSATKIKLHELDTEEEKLNYLLSNTSIKFKLKDFIDLYKGKDLDIPDLAKLKKICEDDLNGTKYYYKNMGFLNVADSVFRYYQSYLSRNHLIDFNDMVNKAIKVIEKEGFENDYKYIFVDEYQDMSYKNFQLVNAIKDKTNANLVVVGDDWQSIYGFRDSDLKLFTDFDEYFPDAKRVFIEKTYRNPQQLIDTAGNFIMRNDDQFKKSLQSDLSCDKPIKIVYHSKSLEKEHNTIHNLIYNLSRENSVLILGRHRKDIDEFLKETDFVKKGRSKNHKQIADKNGILENVEYRTIHKAKGLEADYTIIIQVIDDMVGFPNKLYPSYFMKIIHDWDNDDKLQEERRLFYVALTRARKGVYIFTNRSRESEYIGELKDDSLNNLEMIYPDDEDTYSHLTEFNKVPKVKKSRKVKKSKVNYSHIDMENTQDIEVKANLKDFGNKLIKSKEYDDAEDFYKKLITNMFYVNDYYPYRKLTEVYRKKKESIHVLKVIEAFFKSERYCSESQLSWFRLEYRKACKYTGEKFSKFDDFLDYFAEHGFKNKDKQNNPVVIAARIKTGKYGVRIISQEDFDEKSRKKDLELKYKYERKFGTSKKTLEYLEELWQQDDFTKNLTAYKRLCSLYEDTGQYEKVIEVAQEYFNSNAKRTRTSPDWFKRKISKAKSKLGEDVVEEDIIVESSKLDKKTLNNRITVSNKNHIKLLSCNIGDIVTIKKSRDATKFEVKDIYNPNSLYEEIDDEVIIKTSRENYEVIKNLNDDLLIVGHKNRSGEVTLKVLHNN